MLCFWQVLLALLIVPCSALVGQQRVSERTGSRDFGVVEFQGVRVVFPTKETVDSALANALVAVVLAQEPFPGLPLGPGRVTVSLTLEDPTRYLARADLAGNTVLLPIGIAREGSVFDLNGVLRHELAHLSLYEFVGERVPRWFGEGYAEWARGGLGCLGEMRVRVALQLHRSSVGEPSTPISLASNSQTRVTYDFFTTIFMFFEESFGPTGVEEILAEIRARGFSDGLLSATGLTQADLEGQWTRFVWDRFGNLDGGQPCSGQLPSGGGLAR